MKELQEWINAIESLKPGEVSMVFIGSFEIEHKRRELTHSFRALKSRVFPNLVVATSKRDVFGRRPNCLLVVGSLTDSELRDLEACSIQVNPGMRFAL